MRQLTDTKESEKTATWCVDFQIYNYYSYRLRYEKVGDFGKALRIHAAAEKTPSIK